MGKPPFGAAGGNGACFSPLRSPLTTGRMLGGWRKARPRKNSHERQRASLPDRSSRHDCTGMRLRGASVCPSTGEPDSLMDVLPASTAYTLTQSLIPAIHAR
jgi:hypothetical protein